MKKLHTLTALLTITAALPPRLDGTPPKDEKKPTDPSSDKREMTKEQWEASRRAELDKETTQALVNRIVKVEGDNHALRQKQAPDGGIVLDAEQKKEWDAYLKLGKAEEVGKAVEQGKKDRVIVEKGEKDKALSDVAKAASWDTEAFVSLNDMTPGLEWRVQEVKKGEEKIQQAQVKVGDEWKDAETFAEERWKKFLPVLQTADQPDARQSEPETVQTVRVPTGGAGGGKGKVETVAEAEARKASSGDYRM